MNARPSTRSPLIGLSLCLLSACGSGHKPASELPTGINPKPGSEEQAHAQRVTTTRRGPAVDLSAVTKPSAIVGEIRVASPVQMAQQIDRILGRTVAAPVVNETWTHFFGDGSDRVLDSAESVDIAVVASTAGQEPEFVLSIPTKSPDEVEAAFGQKYRFTARGDGTRTIAAIAGEADANARERLDTCVLSPAPRPGTGRLICSNSNSANARDLAAPYLARTLTRNAVAANQISVNLDVTALRRTQGDSILRELEADRTRGQSELANLGDPVARQSMLTVYNKVFDALKAIVSDSTNVSFSLDINDARALLSTSGEGSTANSPLLRALTSVMQNNLAPTSAQLGHLLPDALSYYAGSIDGKPLDPTIAEIIQAVESAAVAANIPAAERTALSQALATMRVLDQSAVTGQVGYDNNGKPWYAITVHTASRPGTDYVMSTKTLINTLKRPYFQSKVRELIQNQHVSWDPASLRDARITGIPANAYAFQFALPTPETSNATPPPAPRQGRAPARGNTAARAGANAATVMQVIMVPDGNDIHVVASTSPAALLQRYQSNTTAGVDTNLLVQQGWAISDLLVLAGVPNLIRSMPDASVASTAQSLQTAVDALADHGRTPIALRMGSTDVNNSTRVSMAMEFPAQAIRAIMALIEAASNAGSGSTP